MTLDLTARVRGIKPSPTLGMAAEAAAEKADRMMSKHLRK